MIEQNNNYTTAKPYKDCSLCNINIASLNAKELHGKVTYFYKCSYARCNHIEEIK